MAAEAETPVGAELAQAIADDAAALAVLHDRELTPAVLLALRESHFPASLGLLPDGAAAAAAWRAMADAIKALAPPYDAACLDRLAAEYAAVYLTGAYRASPHESAWTDDDGLICQTSMFELRDIYAAAGLAATDWRKRPDDHLVVQLLYIAHAFREPLDRDGCRRLAQVLDDHLLRWLPEFAGRIVQRAGEPFYAGLALLTAAWLETLRELLAHRLGEPRPPLRPARRPFEPQADGQGGGTFVPGCGPGW